MYVVSAGATDCTPGYRGKGGFQPLVERNVFPVRIPWVRRIHIHQQQMVGAKAHIDRLQPCECSQKESRADHQQRRKRNLETDKRPSAQPLPPSRRCHCSRLQPVADVRSGRGDRRCQPEENSSCNRNGCGEGEDAPVKVDFEAVARPRLFEHLRNCVAAQVSKHAAACASRRGKHRLSTSICRRMRMRPAPSANRTLISRWRSAARASIRLAIFAQASSNTSPTNAISIAIGLPYCCCSSKSPRLPSRRFIRGMSSLFVTVIVPRTAAASCASSAAWAVTSGMPGFARPMMFTHQRSGSKIGCTLPRFWRNPRLQVKRQK